MPDLIFVVIPSILPVISDLSMVYKNDIAKRVTIQLKIENDENHLPIDATAVYYINHLRLSTHIHTTIYLAK